MKTTTIQAELVAWARAQIGVPWVHQGRQPGRALDCIGLAVCAARAVGLNVEDHLEYTESPSVSVLLDYVGRSCIRIEHDEPAALLLFVGHITHAGISTGEGAFIHAARTLHDARSATPDGRVVEVPFDHRWRRRLHSIWRHQAWPAIP